MIVGTGLEKSNATPRWGVARDGSTERNLNFAKGKMQTSPGTPADEYGGKSCDTQNVPTWESAKGSPENLRSYCNYPGALL